FSVNTFVIQDYEPIDKFDNFFSPAYFGKEQFEKYGTMFTLWDHIEGANALKMLKQIMGTNNIGINRSKEDMNNESLIVVVPETKFLGKFLATDIGILVVPSSQLHDMPVTASAD